MSDEDPRTTAASARVGSTLDLKWRLNHLIAVGGMGAVYDATHRNGMRAAIKILDPALSHSVEARRRFLREGRLANRVRHPGAVRVLDDDEIADGTAYLVMELLSGSTLEALAARTGGKLEVANAIEYALQVVDTLAEAHASGIVHRDIKPENLFLTNDGAVKILDFGIAGMVITDPSTKLTRSGEPMGTPAFMAPEQARGRAELVGPQSDLYSLGASLFSLLTGKLVHDHIGTMAELLVVTITRNAPSLSEIMPEAPPALVAAVDRSLRREISERWENAAAMRDALEEAYVAVTNTRAPAPRIFSSLDPAIISELPERVRRLTRTTMRLQRLPRARWLAGIAVVVMCGAIGAAKYHRTPAPVAVAPPRVVAPHIAAPHLEASNSAAPYTTTAEAKPRRYDPAYDRRQ